MSEAIREVIHALDRLILLTIATAALQAVILASTIGLNIKLHAINTKLAALNAQLATTAGLLHRQ